MKNRKKRVRRVYKYLKKSNFNEEQIFSQIVYENNQTIDKLHSKNKQITNNLNSKNSRSSHNINQVCNLRKVHNVVILSIFVVMDT